MTSQYDYKSIFKSHEMKWNDYPSDWYEGPFLGNGETGVSVFFEDSKNLYLNIGNTSIYDNRDNSGKEQDMLFLTPRLPLGGFRLETLGGFVSNDMCLSLYDAELKATMGTLHNEVKIECFVVEDKPAFYFRWWGDDASIRFCPVPAESPRQFKMKRWDKRRMSLDYAAPHTWKTEENDGYITHIQPKYRGGEYRVNYKVYDKENMHTLVCFIENFEIGEIINSSAKEILDSLYENYENEQQKHYDFWHDFYTKSYLSLDDKEMEKFYWIQLYKCASATRKGYRVFDTAGPWLTQSTSWPATWWNLNVELNYSPLYPSNHLELGESLIDEIKDNLDTLRENVPEKYRNGEFCTIGRNTTYTLATPCAVPGEGTKPIELEVSNLIWIMHNCYIHLKSACDDERIKTFLFPVLKGATEYVSALLKEGDDGYLHLPPTCSPEYPGISEDCVYNVTLLMWGLKTLLKLNEKYNLNDKNADKWQVAINKLSPIATDPEQGIMIGRNQPLEISHRHYSHLLGFYPLHIFDENNLEMRELIEKSIAHWQSMPEGLLGYSCTGSASMYAYLGDGNMALTKLEKLFSGYVCPNTMYHEGFSPVLETPPAAARTILDMVMISTGDEIRIFTGTPDKWQNIEYADLLAENGCLVSAKREAGKTTYISIKANKSCQVKLIADISFENLPANVSKFDGCYTVTLCAGEEITLNS